MRVLVVEDEATMATVVARGLRHEGYAVDVADDGDGAPLQVRVLPAIGERS